MDFLDHVITISGSVAPRRFTIVLLGITSRRGIILGKGDLLEVVEDSMSRTLGS